MPTGTVTIHSSTKVIPSFIFLPWIFPQMSLLFAFALALATLPLLVMLLVLHMAMFVFPFLPFTALVGLHSASGTPDPTATSRHDARNQLCIHRAEFHRVQVFFDMLWRVGGKGEGQR